MDKKNLYTQLKCPNEKLAPGTAKGSSELKPGRIYTIGGFTIRFAIKDHRKQIILDDKKYLTLGTVQKGTSRYRLLQSLEPMKGTDATTPGETVSALRISGFTAGQEQAQDTQTGRLVRRSYVAGRRGR